MIIAGEEITFHERPKHRSVRNVNNIMTEWLLSKIDIMKYDMSVGITVLIKKAIEDDPLLVVDLTEMQQSLESDQTIMLATGLTYKGLAAIKEEAFDDEFQELYKKSVATLGGTANDFFGNSSSNMSSKKAETTESLPSETSTNQPATSSETSTEPCVVKMSTSQD